MTRPGKTNAALAYSAVGLAALFLALVAVNYLASKVALRADLTEGNLYTLSPGTRKVLRALEAPVRVKLYISSGEAMPVPLRGYARRVVSLVEEFKAVAGPNLVVERYDPRPDSEEEDAAQLDGIEPQTLASGEQFYLGLAASRLERQHAIPVLTPARERLLEYDLIRAIARAGRAERPRIGLMSALPVLGEKFNPYTRRGSEPWVLANELRRDFDVQRIDLSAQKIDGGIDVLLLIHPRDIPQGAEYALDQFVLRGGKLIAFVDPYAYFDPLPAPMPGMPPQVTSSALPHLFKAWGVTMAADRVVADVVFASGEGQRYTPTVLSLNRTAFARDDVVMGQIESLLYAFGGALEVKPAAGLAVTELVKSSPSVMLVDRAKATASGQEATRDFVPGNASLPLALRLTGRFRTAFPEGRPAEQGAKPGPAAAQPHLAEGARDNAVVLVADTDLLQDGAAVDVQEVFGRRVIVPSNGNLAFAQGLVEQLAADESLLDLKSRAAAFRPLAVVREMEAQAQLQYFGKIKELEDELQKTNQALQALQGGAPQGAAKGAQILSPEQQAELERFRRKVAETRLALKELRKNLRRDAERLVFLTKIANIGLMPLLVALAGLGVAFLRRRRQARLAAA